MSKKINTEKIREIIKKPKTLCALLVCCAVLILICAAAFPSICRTGMAAGRSREYRKKISLLKKDALANEIRSELDGSPAGDGVGQAVFISVCNTKQRADVFTGVGPDLDSAWNNANKKALNFLKNNDYDPKWVKADIVYTSETVTQEELAKRVIKSRHEFFRYGIAFDSMYETALLEAELNGAQIYAYDDKETGLDFRRMNIYLKNAGRTQLKSKPENFTLFQCYGWFCGEDNKVYPLYSDGLEYGRRKLDLIDADYSKELLINAGNFLVNQVNEDGSFVYGMYPRFDDNIEGYNIVRHAGTIWSLATMYRITGDESLKDVIESTIGYLLDNVVYKDENTAYVYDEASKGEIKLGACGLAVISLAEYMDAFQNTNYVNECRCLGNGILTMLNQDTGEYYHVLEKDFSNKNKYRTVYYDGEATFALCRLYELTNEDVWLNAAKSAVGHFIEADYTQHKDHWVAYSMNEITKYVNDPEYYTFALRNAQENLNKIYGRDTTYHTYLEMLMATFQIYDRMVTEGVKSEYLETTFSAEDFLKTIYTRADRMLNGYFYPEYAMYMEKPYKVLNTFMVRHDGYRVRIDDVQHNFGGYYQYSQNYDKLVSYGMLENRD